MAQYDIFGLSREDLIRFEPLLRDSIARVIPFGSHSLYFPQEQKPDSLIQKAVQRHEAIFIPEENKILVPLVHNGTFLGVFVARELAQDVAAPMDAVLFQLGTVALENILLLKKTTCDPLTGLTHERALLDGVQEEIDSILACIRPGPEASLECTIPEYRACLGLVVLRIDSFRELLSTYGHLFGDFLLTRIAADLKNFTPDEMTLAHLGRGTFALSCPQTLSGKCGKLAESLREHVASLVSTHTVTREKIPLSASVGFAVFPQDMQGWQLESPPPEQARILLEKGDRAMRAAMENGGNQVSSFRDILARQGRVLKILPLERLVVSLGRSVDCTEGMRFMVWSQERGTVSETESSLAYPPLQKGEIQLMEVGDEESVAEVLSLNDPGWRMEPGDRLTLLPKNQAMPERGKTPARTPCKDLLTGLYMFRDFLKITSLRRHEQDAFTLLMLRIQGAKSSEGEKTRWEDIVQKVSALIKTQIPSCTGGRYSANTLIFQAPGQVGDWVVAAQQVCSTAQEQKIRIACGLAGYPFLDYSRGDVLENCKKALHHALLLPHPQTVIFDSISLNISADTLFTQGDLYSAIEEYKKALLADESNQVARNSLGICYARIGHYAEAGKQFQRICKAEQTNFMARYNLACVKLKSGERTEARAMFLECLQLKPDHTYTLLRLAQIAEQDRNMEEARDWYAQAAQSEEKDRVHIHLGRMAMKEGDLEAAKEHLHNALVDNPKDAHSLHLLAKIYLDRKEDPKLAETLARRSACLRPGNAEYWEELARALRAQGKYDEAAELKLRSRDLSGEDETFPGFKEGHA